MKLKLSSWALSLSGVGGAGSERERVYVCMCSFPPFSDKLSCLVSCLRRNQHRKELENAFDHSPGKNWRHPSNICCGTEPACLGKKFFWPSLQMRQRIICHLDCFCLCFVCFVFLKQKMKIPKGNDLLRQAKPGLVADYLVHLGC